MNNEDNDKKIIFSKLKELQNNSKNLPSLESKFSSSPKRSHLIKAYLLKILNLREHSTQEARQKLKKKFPKEESELIEKVIKDFTERKYLSDKRFAEMFIKSKEAKGKFFLERALEKKGVSKAIISQALEENEFSELENAKKAAKKKIISLEGKKNKKEKLMRFLYSRGFSSEVIYQLMESDPF